MLTLSTLSLTGKRRLSPTSCLLHVSLRDYAIAVCFLVSEDGTLGSQCVGETSAWLLMNLLLISIIHICTIPPTVSQSLAAVTNKISLFRLDKKDHSQTVTQMMTDRKFRRPNLFKISLKVK